MVSNIMSWVGGFLMGAGITLGVYHNYYDSGAHCLKKYQTAEDVATCVDILND